MLIALVLAGCAEAEKEGAGSAAEAEPVLAGETEESADWEVAADRRIREHRTGTIEVKVVDSEGNPVPDAEVAVEMQAHDYGFGTMIHAEFLSNATQWGGTLEAGGHTFDESDQKRYRETAEELFNMIVLENFHKWNFWEDAGNREHADYAVRWARNRDMDVRGHVAIWGNIDAHAVPPDVTLAAGREPVQDGDWGEPELDSAHIVERSMQHIEDMIEYYAAGEFEDAIVEWEIVNEALHEPTLIEAVDSEDIDPVTAPILGEWYSHAERIADRFDVRIAVNDFNTLAGPYGDVRENYRRQIDYLVNDVGVDLDGVGFQVHFAANEILTPDEILEGIDYYDGFDVRFRATEFDTFQEWGGVRWDSEEHKGEVLYEFLKTFYSHPDTEAFLMWGHWDGVHWGPEMGFDHDAPLFDLEWNPKPAYDYYTDLVFNQWWTEEVGRVDEDGLFSVTAFRGEHEVTITDADGNEHSERVEVLEAGETVTLRIEL